MKLLPHPEILLVFFLRDECNYVTHRALTPCASSLGVLRYQSYFLDINCIFPQSIYLHSVIEQKKKCIQVQLLRHIYLLVVNTHPLVPCEVQHSLIFRGSVKLPT